MYKFMRALVKVRKIWPINRMQHPSAVDDDDDDLISFNF